MTKEASLYLAYFIKISIIISDIIKDIAKKNLACEILAPSVLFNRIKGTIKVHKETLYFKGVKE